MGTEEGKDAFNAYYGIGDYDQNRIEGSYNEDNFEFHVIPEAGGCGCYRTRPTETEAVMALCGGSVVGQPARDRYGNNRRVVLPTAGYGDY